MKLSTTVIVALAVSFDLGAARVAKPNQDATGLIRYDLQ